MANDENIARLRQGVDAWNDWRERNRTSPVNFNDADLGRADLRWADLREANLEGATLSEANLSAADLGKANLREADLDKANLHWADLGETNLTRADLHEANLRGANLTRADLHEANLRGVHLSKTADDVDDELDRGRASASFTVWLWEAILCEAYRVAELGEADYEVDLVGANLTEVNLTGAQLPRANLTRANLTKANFTRANLTEVNLTGAQLPRANLTRANFTRANLIGANFTKANLTGANLTEVQLIRANLTRANLGGVDLKFAVLIETNLTDADLTDCGVYGISAWDLTLEGAKQCNLVITRSDEPKITVDNIEVGQFIYLLLHNEKIRSVIDTITSKVVLILGRFTPERKAVLDALRQELRKLDYLPVLFDFDKPASKDLTGTVSTLANMARFIIADLTDPSCIPHELAMVIPTTVVPVQPILLEGMSEYAMFIDLKKRHHWVLEPYSYNTQEHLITDLSERVIGTAEAKVRELRGSTA